MSSLRPNRLPTEGSAPTPGTGETLAAASGTTVRAAAGTVEATAKGRPSRTGSKRRGKLPVESATTPGASPAARPRAAGAATATVETAPATPEDAVLAAAAAILAAGGDVPATAVPAGQAPAQTASRRVRLRHLRPPSSTRRPALYLAAALVGALGISAASAVGPSAVAETTTVSSSVSVAEQLGITSDSAEIVEDEAPDRLGALVASRAERDAEQAEAAAEQRAADEKAAEEKRAAAAAAAEAARPKAVLPVNGARLTSGYGPRWGTMHSGIDLAAPMHTPEYAVMDGVVLEAGPASGFGLAVYIQHENGDVTVYGHMDQILVSAGQVVQAGETIALLGNRGQSTGPHLHFEVHQGGLDGAKIDPIPWLRERGVKI